MYLVIGRKEQVYAYFEQALKNGHGWMKIRHSPEYRELADDPKFREMIAREGHSFTVGHTPMIARAERLKP